ncbi:MAG: hypothetical protein ACLU38_09360 [Dysosmobacter sp.]
MPESGNRKRNGCWRFSGLAALLRGYAIALTTRNPVNALMLFFVAVILVMLGTYCLFTAGSIALLKRLRANKGFYYQTRHFTAIVRPAVPHEAERRWPCKHLHLGLHGTGDGVRDPVSLSGGGEISGRQVSRRYSGDPDAKG